MLVHCNVQRYGDGIRAFARVRLALPEGPQFVATIDTGTPICIFPLSCLSPGERGTVQKQETYQRAIHLLDDFNIITIDAPVQFWPDDLATPRIGLGAFLPAGALFVEEDNADDLRASLRLSGGEPFTFVIAGEGNWGPEEW